MKRAVLYARVSGDDRGNDGRNLTGQLDMCREHALKREWDIVAELAEDDRGASGASFELPQLDRVREMAQAGDFDVLVVREIDRLSRNLAKQLIVEEELRRAGLVARLEAATLTDDQIQDIMSLAAELTPGLEEAEEDLTARRVLVRKLKVQAVLSTEAGGRQVVDVSCVIDRGRFALRQLASFGQRSQ